MVSRIKTFLRIIATVKNWQIVLLAYVFFSRNFFAVFRNGYKMEISRETWKDFMNYVNFFRIFPFGEIEDTRVKIKYGSNNLIFHFGRMGPCVVNEVFGADIYKSFLNNFNINGKTIIDIGASFGDTVIYFALNGAKKIYAFEPLPSAYKLAEENIKFNNLQNKCCVINAAVGWGRGAYWKYPKFEYVFERDLEEYRKNKAVPIITLQDIIDRFSVKDAVLKIDCEGCEYDIILNSPDELLKRFEFIIMEYHYGFEDLQKKFEIAGFSIKCGKSKKLYADDRRGNLKYMSVGYLEAIRKFKS